MSSLIKEKINEYGVYEVGKIIDNFDNLIGISYLELEEKFIGMHNDVVGKSEIMDYCVNKFSECSNRNSVERIIYERMIDYDILYKTLNIYKDKGLMILMLVRYLEQLGRGRKVDSYYEKYFDDLNISHVKDVVCGKDVIKVLSVLKRIVFEFDKVFVKINNFTTYDRRNFDDFALGLGEKLYPSRSLVRKNDDVTSISVM